MYRIYLLVAYLLSALAYAQTDYRLMMSGEWQCQSHLQTDYGNTLVVGEANLLSNGDLTGHGNLVLKHPSFTQEIPLAFQLTGEWLLFKTQLLASNIDGQLYSESPVLNSMARAIQQQIGQTPFFAAQLKTISVNTMAFATDNNSDIECVRKNNQTN